MEAITDRSRRVVITSWHFRTSSFESLKFVSRRPSPAGDPGDRAKPNITITNVLQGTRII